MVVGTEPVYLPSAFLPCATIPELASTLLFSVTSCTLIRYPPLLRCVCHSQEISAEQLAGACHRRFSRQLTRPNPIYLSANSAAFLHYPVIVDSDTHARLFCSCVVGSPMGRFISLHQTGVSADSRSGRPFAAASISICSDWSNFRANNSMLYSTDKGNTCI